MAPFLELGLGLRVSMHGWKGAVLAFEMHFDRAFVHTTASKLPNAKLCSDVAIATSACDVPVPLHPFQPKKGGRH